MKQTILLRKSAMQKNENHNLFKNGKDSATWWCHFTISNGPTQERIRCSLKTKDLDKAKKIRDSIINDADKKGMVTWR